MRPVGLAALACFLLTDIGSTKMRFDPDGGPRRRPPPRSDPRISPTDIAAARLRILQTAREEARRIGRTTHAALAGNSWVNLGPADGLEVYAGQVLGHVGSGRLSAIRVDPRDPDRVYLASAGGGLWKTWNFSAEQPDWHPMTEMLGTLQIGALDLDPHAPDTIYLGLGDFFDGLAGVVVRSRNGGRDWDDIVALPGSRSVRDLRVDPDDGHIVLAATDGGLFRSTDGGDHFDPIDLPNPGGTLAEAMWSLAPLGGGHWLATGVQACDRGRAPPLVAAGLPAGPRCRLGNLGDVWRSSDGGASWTSARAGGGLPNGIGRLTLGAGHAVVYAMTETADEGLATNRTSDILRSTDGGATWTSASGTLSNPIVVQGSTYDCRDLNIGHDQSWYNQAVAVDPTNDDHVIIGGQVCSVRTLSGTSSQPRWDNVSFSDSDYPVTPCGALSAVHPDWHAAIAVRVAGTVRVYASTDGGIFTADNVFAEAPGNECAIQWQPHNVGIVSHQFYALASGDPGNGNPDMTYASAQDNGTLYRNPAHPTEFDMMSFGDGVGSVATPEILWLSLFGLGNEAQRFYCRPAQSDCSQDQSWVQADPAEPMGDATGFIAKFAAAGGESGGVVLSYTNFHVWRSDASGPTWESIGQFQNGIENVAASPDVPHVYGALIYDGHAAVTSDGGATWTMSVPIGVGTRRMYPATTLAFPPGDNGDVYVVGSNAPTLTDGTPVPDDVGHLFATSDRGRTFRPLLGLPNVPVEVVKYDPRDAQTIYAGTEIGVYRSQDGGATWARFGEGLPMVRVTDLFIAKNSTLLRVSTFGRGVWEIYPTADTRGVPGDGDFDRNGQLDFTDLAALTARLGTTPATDQQPYYSWLCDLIGDHSAVDADDLAALLARFGDHP